MWCVRLGESTQSEVGRKVHEETGGSQRVTLGLIVGYIQH